MRNRALDRCAAAGFDRPVVHPPRQIYASTADRRHGRRWNGVGGADRRHGRRWNGVGGADRRRRSLWVPAAVLAFALAAGEALRNLA
jgi:hypothetical protein